MLDNQTYNLKCSLFGHTVTFVGKDTIIILGGAQGDPYKFQVKDTNFIFQVDKQKWRQGEKIPEQKAAHASCSFNSNFIVTFGGITQQGKLCNNELQMYLINQNNWQIVPVQGETPQSRYGHTLCYSTPNIILYGGNNGQENIDETWILNAHNQNLQWQKLQFDIRPQSRIYHTANICPKGQAQGMMIIFGGRCNNNNILNELWGLVKHRNGDWEWQKAPIDFSKILPRSQVKKNNLSIAVFLLKIFYLLLVVKLKITSNKYRQIFMILIKPCGMFQIINFIDQDMVLFILQAVFMYLVVSTNKIKFKKKFYKLKYLKLLKIKMVIFLILEIFKNLQSSIIKQIKNERSTTPERYQSNQNQKRQPVNQNNEFNIQDNSISNIRLGSQVEVAFNLEQSIPTIKKIQINSLQDESKKIGQQQIIQKPISKIFQICNQYIQQIIVEKQFLILSVFNINLICEEMIEILKQENTLLQLRTPIKIFGNLHGNLHELLRIFETYGYPHENYQGDIERMNYLFLGDYIDRGTNSFQIYLLRGNHEDRAINKNYGFADECGKKFDEDTQNDDSVYQMINKVFEYLPLATVLDDKYFCVHGGIGQTCFQLQEIQNIQRPIRDVVSQFKNQQIQLIQDLLWSDLVYLNEKGQIQNIIREIPDQQFKFGSQQIQKFLDLNKLQCIIRSHECCEQGYEVYQNSIVTVFSVSNYCGINKNQSAILLIKKNGEIVPKQLDIDINQQNWINVRKVSPVRQK